MEKGKPSELDTFMTAHGKDLQEITDRTREMVDLLQMSNFHVRRYKIEDTVMDSRTEDVLQLL